MRKITLGTLNISEAGKNYVNDAMNHNRLSNGPYTKRFEDAFAKAHQSKHAIFMNSGTSALQVALATMKEVHGYKDGDEVLVPALTFIATSNVVIQNGLKPVFIDVNPETFNMNWYEIEKHITPRTRCIIPVHLFGLPANMEKIMQIADTFKLQVIEDSCETMLAGQNGKSVGSFGDMACFSTYVAHLVVGGVGGLITTQDANLEQIARSFMAHGRDNIYTNIDQDDTDEPELLKELIERRFKFDRVGYSYRATEFEAAIALSELERASENIAIRRENAKLLADLLGGLHVFLQLPFAPAGMTHSFMMYPMLLKKGNRDNFLMHLEKNGIETRYMFPLLGQPIYQKLFPRREDQYPTANYLSHRGFFIGMHQGLSGADMLYIYHVIKEYFA